MTDPTPATLWAMALSRVECRHRMSFHPLCERLGGLAALAEHAADITSVIADAPPRLPQLLAEAEGGLDRARDEFAWARDHGCRVLTIADEDYPQRLLQCADPPLAVYYRGTADLNARHVVSVVGTRKVTPYGRDLIQSFTTSLARSCPETLVVSGLAYGVDADAHRGALASGLPTVGVVAHGLDMIYPRAHQQLAREMTRHGGVLTEFATHTQPVAANFVRRNRIVAGMADAVVLVESASKGGGLITTTIARSYGRDVFAFPGPVGAPWSEGCNNLIRDNGATLITSADDMVKALGWTTDARLTQARREGIERQLFPQLDDAEQSVVDALSETNDLLASQLSALSGLGIEALPKTLFTLEMKGVVKPMAGGYIHLLRR